MHLKEYQKCLVIKASNIPNAGLGVFAREFIPKGTRLGWYRGKILTTQQWKKKENDQYVWLMLDDNDQEYYIDGHLVKRCNKLRYVNGAMTTGQKIKINCSAFQEENKMWYETTRRIFPNEELIVDYGDDFEL